MAFLVALAAPQAHAGKLDAGAGVFQITSKTQKAESRISNFGVYRIGYFHPILEHLDIGIAYTLVMSGGFGGDLGYGLDVGANWFPLTRSGQTAWKTPELAYAMVEPWRPYAGISFNQRQFQSIQAGYAGFGLNIGCERSLVNSISAKAEGRYLRLAGPSQGSITEWDGYAGISVEF